MRLTSLFFCILLLHSLLLQAQRTDTLSFYSNAFQASRSIYVQTPEFFDHAAAEVQFPVMIVLDAQHSWFYEPVRSDIVYLQFTKQLPQTLIVGIPLENRAKECGLPVDSSATLPLFRFITEEIPVAIKKYRPGPFKMLIGHSFSASFALDAYLRAPDYFTAVLAHTPLDELERSIRFASRLTPEKQQNILLSVGSDYFTKDMYNRRLYDSMQQKYPDVFEKMHTFVADFAAHNAVPLVAGPVLLTEYFSDFSKRFDTIARVDLNYQLVSPPEGVDKEFEKISKASMLLGEPYAPELPELNGLASRYLNSGYTDHAIAIFSLGMKHYPNDYGFPLDLALLFVEKDPEQARQLLEQAVKLLPRTIKNPDEQKMLLEEIEAFKAEQGW